jgi:hypothetical protein
MFLLSHYSIVPIHSPVDSGIRNRSFIDLCKTCCSLSIQDQGLWSKPASDTGVVRSLSESTDSLASSVRPASQPWWFFCTLAWIRCWLRSHRPQDLTDSAGGGKSRSHGWLNQWMPEPNVWIWRFADALLMSYIRDRTLKEQQKDEKWRQG